MPLRFAFGSASAKNNDSPHPLTRAVCRKVISIVGGLADAGHEGLLTLKERERRQVAIDGHKVLITIYKREIGEGKKLIVVQSYLRTWREANHVSMFGIGQTLAEGILILPCGKVVDAPEDLVNRYR